MPDEQKLLAKIRNLRNIKDLVKGGKIQIGFGIEITATKEQLDEIKAKKQALKTEIQQIYDSLTAEEE